MAKRLEGKAAVITGSSQGIGRAVALSMAAEGAKVIVNNRKPSKDGGADAEKVAKEITDAGGIAIPVYGDCSIEADCIKLVDTCVKEFGSVDILLNNAGIASGADLDTFTEEDALHEFRISLFSAIYTCREAMPHMLKNGFGRILNVSSITALMWSYRYTLTYTCVKSAMIGFTRLLARTYGHEGVTANIVMPDVNTRLTDTGLQPVMEDAMTSWYMYGTMSKENLDHCLNLAPPEEAAAFYTYLATPEAGFINGKTFKISEDVQLFAEPDRIRRLIHKPGDIWTVDEFDELAFDFMEGLEACPPYPPQTL